MGLRPLAPLLLLAAPVFAQAPAELEPITVDAPRLERDWLSTPSAIGVVATEDAQQGRQHLGLDESLARIPGVFLQNRYNFAQGLRISIRGFGARSPFGVRGVKVIVDGIPETVVDGSAQTDIIDLTSVERIEVIRGPASVLYGNATGGVIFVETFDPPAYPLRRLRLDYGSYGYHRESVQAGNQYEDWGYFLSAFNLGYDGFRAHNEADKQVLNGKFNLQLGGDASLETVVRVLDAPDTLDPGALTRAQVAQDRSQARPANEFFDSRQSASQQTVGLTYRNPIGNQQDFTARLFYTNRDYIQYLPFTDGAVVTYDRAFFGGGLQTARRHRLWGRPNKITVGVDVRFQRDDRQRFDNIAGDKGALVFDQLEKAHSIGVFAQEVFAVSERLDLSAGIRYDDIVFEIDDRFMPPGDPDDSGKRDFSEISAAAGASYEILPHQNLYASIGTAFQTPTFTEFADPDNSGGFNAEIEAQEAINYEVGAKGFFGSRLRYSLALFYIEVEDELVVFESAGGRDFFENSGESERRGLEALAAYSITPNLTATGAFTYSDFEFEAFVDSAGNSYAGNRIPGIPESQFFAELAYRKPGAGFAIIDLELFDELYADNANSVKVDGYGVVNARIGLVERLWRRPLILTLGINNLLDEKYFSNIRINAFGGRYFEPAPDRNIYVSAELSL